MVTIVRHAEAASISSGKNSDAERPLTARGMADALAIGRMISLLDDIPSLVMTSPLLRAVQTGGAIAQSINPSMTSSVNPILAPGVEPRQLVEELAALRRSGVKSLLAVAHQPDVGEFITYTITGRGTSSLGLPPGAAARLSLRISGAHPEGILQWLLPPDAARAFVSIQPTTSAKP